MHIAYCCFAILEHEQVRCETMRSKCLADEKQIGWIVLNNNHRSAPTHGLLPER